LADLSGRLSVEGLTPIQVEGSTDDEDVEGLIFVGDLNGFIQASKALNNKVVFVFKRQLQDEDFVYSTDDEEDAIEDEEELLGDINLIDLMPDLRDFKEFVGQEAVFRLTIFSENIELNYFVHQEWWSRFIVMRDSAVDKVEENRESIRDKIEETREKRETELVGKLKRLINDSEFTHLPTQIAMRGFAIEKIPELEELDERILRNEVQTLFARIRAKGLYRKR
jgi:hypothetical protein